MAENMAPHGAEILQRPSGVPPWGHPTPPKAGSRWSVCLLGLLQRETLSFPGPVFQLAAAASPQTVWLGCSFCQLPPDRQKCSDESSIRVFYNSKAGVCEKFVYQGCEGNRNNFATQLECLKACSSRDICQLPSDSGFGDAFRFRFFYNAVSRMCESFLYKGSRGNANNFWDKETCVQFCAPEDENCGEGRICCPTGCGTVCRSVKDWASSLMDGSSCRLVKLRARELGGGTRLCPSLRGGGLCCFPKANVSPFLQQDL
ncbi:papilin-like [Crotalus adamanteus]|uniref:Papilin-like n=1 Tax=Crotalus adamanteus TaxID=8729 RepID=A0AAW1BU52_CROAD